MIALQIMKHNSKFSTWTKIWMIFLMRRSLIFFSDVIMIFYFHFSFFISISTNPTFRKFLKIFMIFVGQNKRFIKFCFILFRKRLTFFYHLIKTFVKNIFTKVSFAWFNIFFINKY